MTTKTTAVGRERTDFLSNHFVGYDFDGTVALTFAPSPHNVTVASAYDTAIDAVFGARALMYYRANGGLGNRAPIEIVKQLAPEALGAEQVELLGRLDNAKLAVLLEEITEQWPRPTVGYHSFVQRLQSNRRRHDRITDAIISSGHESFIAKTYNAWGMQMPTIILAQEAISAMAMTEKIALPTKPSTTIMRFAHTAWRANFGHPPTPQISASDAARMQYIGDDKMKDGQMAANAGIKFHLLDPSNSQKIWDRLAGELELATLRQAKIV